MDMNDFFHDSWKNIDTKYNAGHPSGDIKLMQSCLSLISPHPPLGLGSRSLNLELPAIDITLGKRCCLLLLNCPSTCFLFTSGLQFFPLWWTPLKMTNDQCSIDHSKLLQWIVRLQTSHSLPIFFILMSQIKHWKNYKAHSNSCASCGGVEVAGWTVDQETPVRFLAYPHRIWALWWQGGWRHLWISQCLCQGRLCRLKTPGCPWPLVAGSRSKFGHCHYIAEISPEFDLNPQSTNQPIQSLAVLQYQSLGSYEMSIVWHVKSRFWMDLSGTWTRMGLS